MLRFDAEAPPKAVIFQSSPFKCDGWLRSFQFYRLNEDPEAYLGLWHQDNRQNFVLTKKIPIPRDYTGMQRVDFSEQWEVKKGHYLGVHYSRRARRGIVGFTTDSRSVGPSDSLQQTKLIDIFDEDIVIENPLRVSTASISSVDAAYSFSGDFSTNYEGGICW